MTVAGITRVPGVTTIPISTRTPDSIRKFYLGESNPNGKIKLVVDQGKLRLTYAILEQKDDSLGEKGEPSWQLTKIHRGCSINIRDDADLEFEQTVRINPGDEIKIGHIVFQIYPTDVIDADTTQGNQ